MLHIYRVFVAFAALALVPAAGSAMMQDPTCLEVNNAYIKTRSTHLFRIQQMGVMPDGKMRHLRELKVDSGWAIQKEEGSRVWEDARNEIDYSLQDLGYRKFSSCSLSHANGDASGDVYEAIWTLYPYQARATVWISADGKIAKVRRARSSPGWYWSYDTLLDTYSYDSDDAHIRTGCLRGCVDQ
jgi:hypothetical protein